MGEPEAGLGLKHLYNSQMRRNLVSMARIIAGGSGLRCEDHNTELIKIGTVPYTKSPTVILRCTVCMKTYTAVIA
jgi:hypothetical protein